jgi:hypothetical protein
MRRLFACIVAVVVLSAPAGACLNDSELPSHEREFRSSYQNGHSPSVSPSSSGWKAYAPPALLSAGGALVVAAGFVTFRRLSPKGD